MATSLWRNPNPLVAVALIVALLGFSGCQFMPGKPTPVASQGVGKKAKPTPVAAQLKREIVKRKAAEAKVAELRRALRAARTRPVRSVGGATSTVKHSGQIDHRHSGEVRLIFGDSGRPTFPIIPPPPASGSK